MINNVISNNYNDIVLKIHWSSTLEFKTILIISKLVSGKKKFIAKRELTYLKSRHGFVKCYIQTSATFGLLSGYTSCWNATYISICFIPFHIVGSENFYLCRSSLGEDKPVFWLWSILVWIKQSIWIPLLPAIRVP